MSSTAMLTELAVLPLRKMVIYPHGIHPLFVGTKRSIQALESSMAGDQQILLATKRDATIDDPGPDDLYDVGTVATILQLLPLPDGKVKVLVEGGQRAKVDSFYVDGPVIVADVIPFEEVPLPARAAQAVLRSLMGRFETLAKSSKEIRQDVVASLSSIDDPARLVDTIAAQAPLKLEAKQSVLATFDLKQRVQRIEAYLDAEIEARQMDKRIRGRVKKQLEKTQREYYLNEQIKAINKELGDLSDAPSELDTLKERIDSAGMPKEARKKAANELAKLRMMAPMSAEATVVRSYLDWMLSIPWKKRRRVRRDLRAAQQILDDDHYGLEEVKERVLEYLAVQGRVKKLKGPVLCLVGAPGVGKTSLGESIARATNRKYVRMALGGVRDEAEIRGHRRTYIGSMPGKILQRMAKAGVRNPLFLLDEIDKMGMDVRGDPASALLEVLDPEQNHAFNDHYLEVDYDLSDVFFVCTSNSMNIPPALLDRMEVIRLAGYTEEEKRSIASRFLIPKQKGLNGLGEDDFTVSDDALTHMIRYYTKEAGVRGLEREIAKLCRKVVTEQSLADDGGRGEDGKVASKEIDVGAVESYNGVRKYTYGRAEKKNQVGVVTGLAWTQAGGELLNIEALAVAGKGQQIKTGSLGDVMQESIQAALTFVRSRAPALGIPGDFHERYDLHIHVPEGATRKDGPSAGIGMCTALVSVLTGIAVSADLAMTGEITLRGQVLPIGGLKEKLLAAHRGGVARVVIPAENARDLKEVPDNIKDDLEILPVVWLDDVMEAALERRPEPCTAESGDTEAVVGPPEPEAQPGEGLPISAH
ncbi:MAG: endopeptidase La [Gammaproteobacteria bacterium]|nr:endopeptidase La [Gammaproteobacteria bacterium]